jgi:hypothetical protein
VQSCDLSVFHEFLPPPTGGGTQFLRAVTSELRPRGLYVEIGRLSASVRGEKECCLCEPSTRAAVIAGASMKMSGAR